MTKHLQCLNILAALVRCSHWTRNIGLVNEVHSFGDAREPHAVSVRPLASERQGFSTMYAIPISRRVPGPAHVSLIVSLVLASTGCKSSPCSDLSDPVVKDGKCVCQADKDKEVDVKDCKETSPDDETGDLPVQCTDLGILSSSATFKGEVQMWDADYFCFQVTTVSGITLEANPAAVTLEVFQYKDAVTPTDSFGAFAGVGGGHWELPPGRYALNISQYLLTTGPYVVSLSNEDRGVVLPDPDPGETGESAYPLLATAELTTTDGYVGPLDPSDVYRVEVPSGKKLAVQLEHLGTAGAVSLAISDDQPIAKFSEPMLNVGHGTATLADNLPEGSHLLKVSGAGPYRLGVALQAQ